MAARRSGWSGCCASISCSRWFNLSDPAVEEALYDSLAMRRFVGIDLGREPVPDETTVCRFRHLLESGRAEGTAIDGIRSRKSGSHRTPRWRKRDSNRWSPVYVRLLTR